MGTCCPGGRLFGDTALSRGGRAEVVVDDEFVGGGDEFVGSGDEFVGGGGGDGSGDGGGAAADPKLYLVSVIITGLP
jgi:hypothetical protein